MVSVFGSYSTIIFLDFSVFSRREIDHFSRFSTRNSKSEKCASLESIDQGWAIAMCIQWQVVKSKNYKSYLETDGKHGGLCTCTYNCAYSMYFGY